MQTKMRFTTFRCLFFETRPSSLSLAPRLSEPSRNLLCSPAERLHLLESSSLVLCPHPSLSLITDSIFLLQLLKLTLKKCILEFSQALSAAFIFLIYNTTYSF